SACGDAEQRVVARTGGSGGELGRRKEGFWKGVRPDLRRARGERRRRRAEQRIQEAPLLLLFRQMQGGVRARGGADSHAGGRSRRRSLHPRQSEVGSRLKRRPRRSVESARSVRLRAAPIRFTSSRP